MNTIQIPDTSRCYFTFAYVAIDHCTGRQWVSQYRAACDCGLRADLRSIYGNGLEILNVIRVETAR